MASQQGRSFDAIVRDLSQNLQATNNASYFVNTLIQSIPLLSTIRVCLEAGVLSLLVESGGPLAAKQIAQRIHADNEEASVAERRDFVVRMLRGVLAFGLVDEVEQFTYQANDLTRAIASPAFAGGFNLVFDDNFGPQSIMSEMVTYHKARGWRASDSGQDGPYQRANNVVGMSSFHHWAEFNPIQASRLSGLMQVVQKHRVHYFSWLPKDVIFEPASACGKRTYVDVGGGRGHDIRALSRHLKDEDVRFVLQDLPNVVAETKKDFAIDEAGSDARIELMPHDFFDKQPVEGADVYYMHKIMHDWPDKDCVHILEKIRDAMGPHSKALLCDFILPNRGTTSLQTAFDIDMLSLHSGVERDEEMWKRLVQKVDGLQVQKLWQPPSGEGEGIVEITKASTDQGRSAPVAINGH